MEIRDETVTVIAPYAWDRIVGGAGADWPAVLTLRIAGGEEHLSMPGSYAVEGRRLVFRPAFPLLEREEYVARFEPAGLGGLRGPEAITRTFTAGARGEEPAGVRSRAPELTAIYPSADTLPANHLKFYLHFSEPMRRGDIFRHGRVVNESDGREVPEPFRETELWSEDGRRLTLWLHPGRQKTGVNLNVEIGPVLEEGKRYRLVIAGDWESESGVPMGRDHEKAFVAGAADHDQPRVADWMLAVPRAGTTDVVALEFPEPFDRALLESKLRVEATGGVAIDGRVQVQHGERRWAFAPESAWAPGNYRIAVETVLEDLAGNSLARPFEVDLTVEAAGAAGESAAVEYLPFAVEAR